MESKMQEDKIPSGVRIIDTGYFIPRPDVVLEKWLDVRGFRLPNSLEWAKKYDVNHTYLLLSSKIKGKEVLVAGRGKSIHLPSGWDSPIIAVNSAANFFVEKGASDVYLFRGDPWDGDGTEELTIPAILANLEAIEGRETYLYHPLELGELSCSLSGIVAIKMMLALGASSVKLTGFDSVDGDASHFNTETTTDARDSILRSIPKLQELLQDPRVTILEKSLASESTRKEDHTPPAPTLSKLKSSSKTASSSSKSL